MCMLLQWETSSTYNRICSIQNKSRLCRVNALFRLGPASVTLACASLSLSALACAVNTAWGFHNSVNVIQIHGRTGRSLGHRAVIDSHRFRLLNPLPLEPAVPALTNPNAYQHFDEQDHVLLHRPDILQQSVPTGR